MTWLTDVRKLALLALVTTAVDALWPAGGFSTVGPWVRGLDAVPLAVPLLFLWLLHRSRLPLCVSQRLRRLALAAGVGVGIASLYGLAEWAMAEQPYFDALLAVDWSSGGVAVRAVQSDPRTWELLRSAVEGSSNVALLLLLLAFRRVPGTEISEGNLPQKSLLRRVTRIALGVGYAISGLILLRFPLTPFLYSMNSGHIFSAPAFSTPAFPIGAVLAELTRELLFALSLTAIPFIVSRSLPKPLPQHGPQEIEHAEEGSAVAEAAGLGDHGNLEGSLGEQHRDAGLDLSSDAQSGDAEG